MKSIVLPLALATSVLATFAASGAHTQVLPQVDVVARPLVEETALNRFSAQTTTVGREQIDHLNAGDTPAALRRTPGVSIARYNPVGNFGGGEGGAVFLRGLGSSRPGGEIKTLIDGVPVGNGVFNHPMLDLLPVDLAAGIEISRRVDPLTAGNMFASINLTVPRVGEGGSFAQASLSAGSFGAFSEKLQAGGRWGDVEAYVGQSYRRADGHRPDADGRLTNGLVRLGWNPWPAIDLSYLVHRTDNRATDPGPEAGSGLPPTRGDVYTTKSWLHLLGANWRRQQGEGSFKAFLNDGEADWMRRTTSRNADALNDYRRTGLRWRETQRLWEGGEIVAGVDADWTRGQTASVPAVGNALLFGPESVRLLSGFAGASQLWTVGRVQFTPSAGIRYYDHEWFGDIWTPQVGLTAQRGPWRVHAGFSRGANFPGLEVAAFSTVAVPALGQSWRSLRPERLGQTEVGLRYELSAEAAVELTFFRNQGRDRFVFVPPPPPPFRFVNVETFRTEGAELTVTARPAKSVSIFTGVSGLRARPADLPYAPRWSLVGGVTWRIARGLTVGVDSSYVSEQRSGSQARAGGAVNTERVGSFALLNARIGYDWEPRSALRKAGVFLALENLLDRNYRYRPGYPMPGTGFTFGVSAAY